MTQSKQQETERETRWCDVAVTIDDEVTELFEMPELDADPDQQPEFRVTTSTADLVKLDFERYKPSLERMADDWREEKERFVQRHKAEQLKPEGDVQGV